MKRTLIVVASALALSAALVGCGTDATDSVAPVATPSLKASTTAPSTAETENSNTVVITTTVVNGEVEPAPSRVKVAQGQTVKLTVTRDTSGEIHVHGYELEKDAEAGTPVTFTFVADQTGLFEVEAHEPDLLLLQLQVQ